VTEIDAMPAGEYQYWKMYFDRFWKERSK